jgi:three-Cys-motif partner protein
VAKAATVADQGHRFGGAWTEVKLDAVHDYLKFYTRALKNAPEPQRPFELWYIDAFAGSGSRRIDRTTGGLFEGEPLGEETVDLAGSVLRALNVDPPFRRLVFIEENHDRFRSLQEIAASHPERNITPFRGEANAELQKIFGAPPWSRQRNGRGSHRAIVFLDPFGMSVKWETLKLLAETGAVDVWYLFPTGAVNRQLAGDFAKVDEHKQGALDQVFGSSAWRADIYKVETAPAGLFGGGSGITASKTFTVHQIEQYAQNQLNTIFRFVSNPLPLLNDRDSKIFSLFCLSNSSSSAAIGLIKKGVNSILKKYGGR